MDAQSGNVADIELLSRALVWLVGIAGTILIGVVGYLVKSSFSQNASKGSLDLLGQTLKSELSKTIQDQYMSIKGDMHTLQTNQSMLSKELDYVSKHLEANDRSIETTNKRVTDNHDSYKSTYVSRDLFEEKIANFDQKLDMLLKFMMGLQKQLQPVKQSRQCKNAPDQE